ncbi:hypothetical protein LCGC14_3075030, partial [marine sediment metagenome]
ARVSSGRWLLDDPDSEHHDLPAVIGELGADGLVGDRLAMDEFEDVLTEEERAEE